MTQASTQVEVPNELTITCPCGKFKKTVKRGDVIKAPNCCNAIHTVAEEKCTSSVQEMRPSEVAKIISYHPELGRALHQLYFELEASIVENLEVYVARALATHQKELLAKVREMLIEHYGKDGGPALVIVDSLDGVMEHRPALPELLDQLTTLEETEL